MSVLTNSILVTGIREEVVEIAGAGKNSKKGKSDEYLKNLTQVLYIWYPIIF